MSTPLRLPDRHFVALAEPTLKSHDVLFRLRRGLSGYLAGHLTREGVHSNLIKTDSSRIETAERALRTTIELDLNSVRIHDGFGVLSGFWVHDVRHPLRHLGKTVYDIRVTVENLPILSMPVCTL